MGLFSRAYFALLRRNVIYRRRNIVGTFLEIALPVGFVCILLGIKIALEDTDGFQPQVVMATFPNENQAIIPLSFSDYVTSLQTTRICQISDPSADWDYEISGYEDSQNPFLKCDRRRCTENGQNASTFCEYLILALAPSNANDERAVSRAQSFEDYINNVFPGAGDLVDYPFVQIMSSDSAISDYVTSVSYGKTGSPKIGFAIVFSDGSSENDYAYTLRQNSTNFNQPEKEGRPAQPTTPPTKRDFSFFANTDDTCTPEGGTTEQGPLENSCTGQYLYNGAITLQRTVQDWIMVDTGSKGSTGAYVAEHGVQFVSFPTKEYVINGFYASINDYAALLVTLGLLYPVAAILRAITLEKQLRQKELMKMLSVTESDIGWSWFTSFFLFHFVTALCTAAASDALYVSSGFLILFIFWLLAFIAIITFSFAIAAIFTKATTATLIGLLVFFIGYFLTLAADFQESSSGIITLISLHPVAAISYGMQEIGRLEDLGVGVTIDTITATDSPSGYTFVNTLVSLVISAVLWGAMSFYLNRVVRSELGQALPWYFPFMKSYWCGVKHVEISVDEDEVDAKALNVPVEEVSDAAHSSIKEGRGIAIRGLRKQFGDKTAVDGLSLSMYPGEVTALLGHNGAGKTTTISMLTGMYAPTDGYAVVAGKDIRTEMNDIRSDLGICLQHDCLFPDLTVQEHIEFFSRLKGLYAKYPKAEVAEKIQLSIEDVALLEKRHTLSKNLSGGMKRKLSVAIAFCGESKTVLLDEPTSGMDPFSRRFTWNVIRQYRRDRCIVLTTHFMDEADILGDRIAIMAEGQLRCAGSSLFLKKHYGVGYQLTIEKNSKFTPTAGKDDDAPDAATSDETLKDIVHDAVPKATMLSNVGTELSFQLPIGAASQFMPMFEQLDREVDEKKIVTYGVSITTLDEVFLLVARGETGEKVELESSKAQGGALLADEEKSYRSSMDLENDGLFVRHVQSLFRKRALNFKRDKKAWFCSTMLPSFLVLVGFIIFKFAAPNRNMESLELTINTFNPDVKSDPRNPIPFNQAGSDFTCQPGRCMVNFTGTWPSSDTVDDTETWTFCGVGFNGDISSACSISESEEIVGQITEFGAQGEPQNSADVLDSSENIAESATAYAASQFGALHFTHDRASETEEQSYSSLVVESCTQFVETEQPNFVNASYCTNYGGVGYVVNYNYTALHASLIYQALADQALIREGLNDTAVTISATVHPLPLTEPEESLGQAEDAFSAWFLVVLSFPFIAGTFATFVVTEKASKAKHLQTVAGVEPSAYWLSSYMWDILNYQLPLWIIVILMFVFDINAFTTTERGVVGGVIISLILYGPAAAGFTYVCSFLFTSPSMCNLFIIIVNFFVGLAGPLVSFILRLIGDPGGLNNQSLITAANTIEWILRFIPSFNLGSALFKCINIQSLESLAEEPITVWHSSALLYEVIFQAIWCFAYIFLAIQIDKWSTNPRIVRAWHSFIHILSCKYLCSSAKAKDSAVEYAIADDEDVITENERVSAGEANTDLVVLDQLTKVYDTGKVAVNNLSLGIPPGQCFGLLGINGAGKTSAMGMLTAEFPPTSGDATLAGFSVSKEPEKTRRRVGYCPQFDAHFQNMTGREHVQLYASIKGVPREFVNESADQKLREVGLSEDDSNRLSSGYSGGMKRKLSVACALIGNPQMVSFDEIMCSYVV
mmetsp:Transcript_15159/g.25138  ORF Transcript_15159/g.25138 Transcript_15159/m.25138 type:complete len:1684 (-) Transcript_15159:977-6028(-)